jgi:hypothetical protein
LLIINKQDSFAIRSLEQPPVEVAGSSFGDGDRDVGIGNGDFNDGQQLVQRGYRMERQLLSPVGISDTPIIVLLVADRLLAEGRSFIS